MQDVELQVPTASWKIEELIDGLRHWSLEHAAHAWYIGKAMEIMCQKTYTKTVIARATEATKLSRSTLQRYMRIAKVFSLAEVQEIGLMQCIEETKEEPREKNKQSNNNKPQTKADSKPNVVPSGRVNPDLDAAFGLQPRVNDPNWGATTTIETAQKRIAAPLEVVTVAPEVDDLEDTGDQDIDDYEEPEKRFVMSATVQVFCTYPVENEDDAKRLFIDDLRERLATMGTDLQFEDVEAKTEEAGSW